MSQVYQYMGDALLTFFDGNPPLSPGNADIYVTPVFTEEPPYNLYSGTMTVYEPARFRYALIQSQSIGPGLPDFSLRLDTIHGTLTFYRIKWNEPSYSYLTTPDEDGFHYTLHMREL